MIINQILATGGLWLSVDNTEILIDPGPGCIVQSTKRNLRAENLSAVIVSHRHLDHSADVNIMVEAMTQGGLKGQGKLFAPADSLDDEPILLSYLKNRLESVEILEEGKFYSAGNISFTTPIRHIHPVETYGVVFTTARHTFSIITDTHYFDDLPKYYGGELVIINVVFLEPKAPADFPEMPSAHLSVPDAERLIKELKPKVAILTHFGMGMWRGNPWGIAQRLTEKTGVKVIAARDGMRFDLAKLDVS